jgi:hypothetical protein
MYTKANKKRFFEATKDRYEVKNIFFILPFHRQPRSL